VFGLSGASPALSPAACAQLFEEDFFAEDFRLDVFFAVDFFLVDFFSGGGTFSPACRASLSAMAIACFGFFTFRLPPDFSSPCLNSCMTLPTFRRAPGDCFLDELFENAFFETDFLAAVFLPALFFLAAMVLPASKKRAGAAACPSA
jgi:hypothetical protein